VLSKLIVGLGIGSLSKEKGRLMAALFNLPSIFRIPSSTNKSANFVGKHWRGRGVE
jgi:hypothetical protein